SVALIALSQGALAESEDGGYAGAFLNLAVQARPAAMGGAYVGISDDGAGLMYNPAGATAIIRKTLTSSYRVMQLGRKLGHISVILPTRLQSTLGIGWLYAGYGEVDRRDGSGHKTGSTISSNEHAFSISFAKQFTPFLGAGTKLNYYYKEIADINATSIGVNLGVMIYPDSLIGGGNLEGKAITDIKIGLVMSNIASKYNWNHDAEELSATQTDKFPPVATLGGSFRAFDRKLLVAADLEKNFKQTLAAYFGGEYNVIDHLLLRAGLNQGNITAGLGCGFIINKMELSVNYAFSAERIDEGSDHIISFDLNF
ncbi:MAG: PorV/PorQ family protein, partial [candidate division Zixibacteria bacterium]|nr:PorV/PorQ family protein [candidate division Zixibacteria bacterium]